MSTPAPLCPEHGAPLKLRQGRYGRFWGCPRWPVCDVVVGAHPDGRPLGSPGDAAVRQARIRAHHTFDRLWSGPHALMTRAEAYAWLALELGLDEAACHIARFDAERCAEVCTLVRERFPQLLEAAR